jgi:carbamoyl-phosphate synthase large subunit
MKKKLNVLVTGCGGDIGQSVGKILKKIGHTTFGLDISENNAAQFIFDHFEIGLKALDENYLNNLEEFITLNEIDAIIPVSEPELRYFTKVFGDCPVISGAKVVMANHFSREIGFDKKKTCDFLKDNHLPNPKLYTLNSENISFPFIAKPRRGAGSSNIFQVNDFEEFKFISKKYDDLIYQELLDGREGEFTCCAYRSQTNDIRTISFKRELTSGGFSGYGEVVEDNRIDMLLIEISNLLDLKGSINIQLRIHKDVPVVFEINPRFSSTILFRHLLGFKDLEWSLDELFNQDVSNYSKPRSGQCFYKGHQEYIK